MRAASCSSLRATYSRAQQPLVRPSVLNSSLAYSPRSCSSVSWRKTPQRRLQQIAARPKGSKNRGKDEGDDEEAEGGAEGEPEADIQLSPDDYVDLFDEVEEEEEGGDVDQEQQEFMNRLAGSDDDERDEGEMSADSDDEAFIDPDEDGYVQAEEQQSDDPSQTFSIDDLIEAGGLKSEWADPADGPQEFEDFDPSDVMPEGADTLGGLRFDQPEPERAFEYAEPPERVMLFGELLEKCGYDEDVVAQYSDVAEVEVTGVATDSRRIRSGELFVCIEGAHADGHHFIPHAISQGTTLIIAKLMLPGAELALYTDADPQNSDLHELYQEPYYQLAENDTLTMEACSDEMTKVYDKMQGFGQKNKLKEEDIEHIQMAGAMRCISSALNYNFDHWENNEMESPQDEELTPHPFNLLVPMEINTPVAFAIDPQDFVGTLANSFYDRPSERMLTVGVTGTNGKTTVAWLMRSVFEQEGKLTGMIGTVEYALATDRLDLDGDFWADVDIDTTLNRECSAPFWAAPYEGKYYVPCTTPDNVSVQKVMAGMADRGATACVMECSSIGLHQGRVENVDFDVAIFTNLGSDHLDYHEGDVEEYMNSKAYLFESLTDAKRQRAVVNLDDKAAETMATAANNVPLVTYSFQNPDADVYTTAVKFSIWETELTIATPLGTLKIATPLIGRPNVYNILACVAASISIDIDLRVVVAALENAEIVPGRFELIDEGQDFVTMVDYAHTPDALNALLDTARECSDCKRIILVFGCGGDRDELKRPFMGEIAHYKADVVILTNDNPRTEPPEDIIDDIVDGFPEEVTERFETTTYNFLVDVGRVPPIFEQELLDRQGEVKRHIIEDRFCAIRAAIAIAQKNDVVIIAGKGHEDYIEYGDVNGGVFKAWFDDRVEARNALSKLPVLDRIPYLQRKNLPFTRVK